ncbi:MAG: hypothetical protein AAFU54_00200 [Chloroflexota bacterium]
MGLIVAGAIGWSVLSVVVAQVISIGLMWFLGLPPKKLVHEIEVRQNPAVGASFFIIALAVSFFISQFVTNGYTDVSTVLAGTGWIVGALILGTLLMWLSFIIAHNVMGRENNETVLDYIRRELIEEQNASLAFFLGGLAIAPYISVIYQMI